MIFNEVLDKMQQPSKEALEMSLADCHVKGVFSLVIDGDRDENGNLIRGTLTRVFIATKKIKPFDIQMHSHRYNLTIGVVSGSFTHHIADECRISQSSTENIVTTKKYEYKSPLNGGSGLKYIGKSRHKLSSYSIPIGAEISLPCDLIRTVSVSKGTIWIVKEGGFRTDSSVVLGVPFQTEGLYNAPKQYQINDMFTLVKEKLEKVI